MVAFISLKEWCEGDHRTPPSLQAAQHYYDLLDRVINVYSSNQKLGGFTPLNSDIYVNTRDNETLVFAELAIAENPFLPTQDWYCFAGMLLLVLLYPHTAPVLHEVSTNPNESKEWRDAFFCYLGEVFAQKLSQDNLLDFAAPIFDMLSCSHDSQEWTAFRNRWDDHRNKKIVYNIHTPPWIRQEPLARGYGLSSASFSSFFFCAFPATDLIKNIPRFFFSNSEFVFTEDEPSFHLQSTELVSGKKGDLRLSYQFCEANRTLSNLAPHWRDTSMVPMFSLSFARWLIRKDFWVYNLHHPFAIFREAGVGVSLDAVVQNPIRGTPSAIFRQLYEIFDYLDDHALGYFEFYLSDAYWDHNQCRLQLSGVFVGKLGCRYKPSPEKPSSFLPPEARKKFFSWKGPSHAKNISIELTKKHSTWVLALVWLAFLDYAWIDKLEALRRSFPASRSGESAWRHNIKEKIVVPILDDLANKNMCSKTISLLSKMLEVNPKDRCRLSEVMVRGAELGRALEAVLWPEHPEKVDEEGVVA